MVSSVCFNGQDPLPRVRATTYPKSTDLYFASGWDCPRPMVHPSAWPLAMRISGAQNDGDTKTKKCLARRQRMRLRVSQKESSEKHSRHGMAWPTKLNVLYLECWQVLIGLFQLEPFQWHNRIDHRHPRSQAIGSF